MKIQKKLISLFIAISMIISNLIFPLGQIVYAYGEEESKALSFSGNNLVIGEDGTVTFNCEAEDNTGRITFAIYNSEDELIKAESTSYWDEEKQEYVTNEHEAWADLGATSYEGCYLLVSSNDVNLSDLKFNVAGQYRMLDNNKLDLSTDAEHIAIDSYNIRSIYEKKTIQYHSNNLQISNNGRVTLECNLEDNSGIIYVTAYNSDGTVVDVQKYDQEWNEETQQWEEGSRSAFGTLNATTFDGAYLIVESNEVDLTELKFTFTGAFNGEYYETKECFIDKDGKVDLTGCEYVYLDDSAYRLVHEKKRVEFYSDTLVFNEDGTISMNTEIEGNEGQITLELHNADGSKVNVLQGTYWDEELQEQVSDKTRGEAKLNTTTYEGSYLIVTSEEVDLSDIVFDLAGHRVEITNEGRVYLPSDVDWLYIDSWCINEKNIKKTVYFYFEEGITANNDGTITVPCTLKNNNGSLNIALYNSDGTKVNIKKTMFWNDETQEEYESKEYAEGKLNTTTYEGAYFIVTSEDVDLTNVKFNIYGSEILIDNKGKAVFGNEESIDIDKYSIKSVNPIMTSVTVNATSTGGNIALLEINDVDFTNGNTANSINSTLQVEDCDEDHIIINVEEGKIIKTIRFNGEEADLTEQNTGWLNFDYPHEDTYTIELICDDDPYYMPSIFWCYEDGAMGEEDAIVRNGTVEIVSVALPDGETVYDLEELYPEDTPGIGRHPKHDEAYLIDGEEDGYGQLYAQVGSTVTLRLIPDDGYEVSSLELNNGQKLTPDPTAPNQYSLVMTNSTVFLSGLITKITEEQTYFDVTDFGAIPNDGIDDREAINNSLRKAREMDETITVYVPAGEYTISNQLFIYSDTKLVLDKNAVIKSTSSEDMIAMIIGVSDDFTDDHGGYTRLHNIEISGGTWDRNTSSDVITSAIVLQHGNNINIHDLTVKNCTDHMINISADKDVTIKNVTFENHIAYTGTSKDYWDNNEVGNTGRHEVTEAIHTDFAGDGEKGALPLDNTACDSITIDGCSFNGVLAGIGNHHLTPYKAKNITVTNCEFTNIQYGAAVNAWSFENLNFNNNTVTNSNYGIRSIDSSIIVSNNSFNITGQNALKYGVLITGGEANISDNTINGSPKTGIKASNTTGMTIKNNTISDMTGYGLDIENCSGKNTILSNEITAPSNSDILEVGIYVEKSSSDTTIEKNNISGEFKHEIYLNESDATIKDNILDSSKLHAILILNSNAQVISNKITNAGDNAIYALNGEITITGNTIDSAEENGIRADKIAKITINNNIIKNVKKHGIYVTNSDSGLVISSNEISGNDVQMGIHFIKCSGDNVIEKNNIKCGTVAGIYALTSSGTISENNVTGCNGDALITQGDSDIAATFVIRNNTLQTASTVNYDVRLNSYSKNCELSNNILGNRGLKVANGATYTLTEADGLTNIGGTWYYLKSGVVDTSYTGLVEYNNKWYYVQKGELKWGVRTLVQYNGTWYYVNNSTLDWNYTGLCEYYGTEYYIQKGVLHWGVNGLTNIGGTWYYLSNSALQKGYTGLVQYNKSWYYVQNGELKWGENTLVQYNGTWYYVSNSTLDWNYTGLCEYNGTNYYIQKGTLHWGVNGLTNIGGTWYYIKNSMLQTGYTGLVQYNNSWYYVQKGELKWGEKTLVQYDGTWYYVSNSTLDWNYTGLVEYNNAWYYVQKGTLKWGVKTLVQYYGTWYYVSNSTLDWNYTGLVEYNNAWYYVQKGTLKWGVRTLVQYYGTWYYVSNSTLDWNFTGLCEYNGTQYYIQKGVLHWGYNGPITYNGTEYQIKNSMVV